LAISANISKRCAFSSSPFLSLSSLFATEVITASFGGLDFEGLAGARVAAGTGSALADVESAEADQADGVAGLQGALDGFDGGIQRAAGSSLGNVG
jgi:hypothetical protein